MGLLNAFTRGLDDTLGFYKKAGTALLDDGFSAASKAAGKEWSGTVNKTTDFVINKAGKISRDIPKTGGMGLMGKSMTTIAGVQGAQKVTPGKDNIPLVPFL